MESATCVGVTTLELDSIAGQVFSLDRAVSAPKKVYNFPGNTCISVNHEAVHGIPSDRKLQEGDIVKLDVAAEVDGWIADACRTVAVGKCDRRALMLMAASKDALAEAIAMAAPGVRAYQLGKKIQETVESRGFRVLRQLCGHGVGQTIHQEPIIPNFYATRFSAVLKPGMTFTIEPIIAISSEEVIKSSDGWTLLTHNGSLSAHFEHTLLVTEHGVEILTTSC